MNRSFFNVILGGWGATDQSSKSKNEEQRPVKNGNADDAAFLMKNASSVIIVPGYGMAVSQCQHQVREFADLLVQKYGTEIKYAIHPVAGRMPGHMNVLLAEANVPYEQLIEMDEINPEMPEADLALVIGANDTCNPAGRGDEGPLAGMPIIDVDLAQTIVVVKRSLAVGYAGVDNDLFYLDKTLMLFGDGKQMITDLNSAIKDA